MVIHWFRRDLRLEDNTALYHALKTGEQVLPVFIFDPEILERLEDKADARVSLIFKLLNHLKGQLQARGSDLFVIHDTPEKAFTRLFEQFTCSAVFVNEDYEPLAIQRDKKVAAIATLKNIQFKSYKDQVIFNPLEILKPDHSPYTIYTPYSRKWKQAVIDQPIKVFDAAMYEGNFLKTPGFNFPNFDEIGFVPATIPLTQFLSQLPPVVSPSLLASYQLNRNTPSVAGTSLLGPHLRFGSISIRQVALQAQSSSETWLNELIWREFFMQILYHYPHVIHNSFRSQYDQIQWRNNETEFQAWCEGRTGYPFVDAGMRELNATGWMHNRVRMVVASFLCKHLLIDWRWGEHYFAQKLLDYELASNNGNWQWAAGCGCDAAPYFRVFSPQLQANKFDPDLSYITKWIPELNTYQYTQPLVEHTFARNRALKVYKEAVNN